MTQNSDPLNKILPLLTNINTPLPRLQTPNSLHFSAELVIENTPTQPVSTNNKNIQLTTKQLVNFVRQINTPIIQQTTNAPTPYYLQAASTQTPSPAVRRNAQMISLIRRLSTHAAVSKTV